MAKVKKFRILRLIAKCFLGFILVVVLGLIVNNRLCALKYNKLDTESDILTTAEILAVKSANDFLCNNGDDIIKGFKEDTDLIIFNDRYEFLISDNEAVPGWSFVGNNADLGKKIFRRNADNPQAFAMLVGDKWIGSMGTQNRLNKFMVNAVPLFFPPQVIILDDEHYKATIIHEKVHAWQANNNKDRFVSIKTLHDVCEGYYDSQEFNEIILQEAYYLEQAILAEKYEEVLAYSKEFLEMRERRRTVCKMSMADIQNEIDFEWLEGLARYAEYKASINSNSLVAKELLDIDQKVKVKRDDRYYTLGMGQALVLDKLQKEWKSKVLDDNFSMEEYMKEICRSN